MSRSGNSSFALDALLGLGIVAGAGYLGYAYWAPWLGATEILSQIVAVWSFAVLVGVPAALMFGLTAAIQNMPGFPVAVAGLAGVALLLMSAVPLGAIALSSYLVPMNTAWGAVAALVAWHFSGMIVTVSM